MFTVKKKIFLYKEILDASENNVKNYMNEIAENANILNSDDEKKVTSLMLNMRKNYMNSVYNSVINKMQLNYKGTINRLKDIIDNPSLCGYPDIDTSKGIIAGAIYAICFYTLTQKQAKPADCIELNHLQDEIIKKAMHKLDGEFCSKME